MTAMLGVLSVLWALFGLLLFEIWRRVVMDVDITRYFRLVGGWLLAGCVLGAGWVWL